MPSHRKPKSSVSDAEATKAQRIKRKCVQNRLKTINFLYFSHFSCVYAKKVLILQAFLRVLCARTRKRH